MRHDTYFTGRSTTITGFAMQCFYYREKYISFVLLCIARGNIAFERKVHRIWIILRI